MDIGLVQLKAYVETAASLAESLIKDIEIGDQISQETVLALNAFAKAATEIHEATDALVNDPNARYN